MNKARILLVTPNLKGIADGTNRIQPSLGLMLIGELLIQHGHEVKIYDSALDGWGNRKIIDEKNKIVLIGDNDEIIKNKITKFNPDIIAISVLFSNLLESAHNIANIAKKINPNIITILGGNHISNAVLDYKHSVLDKSLNLPNFIPDLENSNFDYAMTGEGEYSMIEFAKNYKNKDYLEKIPGVVKKISEGKYIINSPKRIHNLNDLPVPNRDLVNMEAYFDIGAFHSAKSRSKRVLNVMCSRGCPEKCTFCTTPDMWGNKIRWRSTEHIMKEIKNDVERFKIGEIQFDDDTLTANIKHLYSLCDELSKIGLPWCTPNGIKVKYHQKKHDEMFKKMFDSGCYQVTLACESGVQRVLDEIVHKRLPLDSIYPAIESAKKAGLLVHTFWILGYPGETYEEINKTIEFALNSGADSFSFSILSPLPGTPVYREVMKKNLWWPGKKLEDMLFRSSLVKVDGFKNSDDFEKFVNDTNIKANLALKKRDPARFNYKYGANHSEKDFVKQT